MSNRRSMDYIKFEQVKIVDYNQLNDIMQLLGYFERGIALISLNDRDFQLTQHSKRTHKLNELYKYSINCFIT